jgi:hypothetical protein
VGGEREGMRTSLASVLILMASGTTGLTIGIAPKKQ